VFQVEVKMKSINDRAKELQNLVDYEGFKGLAIHIHNSEIQARIEELKTCHGLTINNFNNKNFNDGWKRHEKEINEQVELRITELERLLKKENKL